MNKKALAVLAAGTTGAALAVAPAASADATKCAYEWHPGLRTCFDVTTQDGNKVVAFLPWRSTTTLGANQKIEARAAMYDPSGAFVKWIGPFRELPSWGRLSVCSSLLSGSMLSGDYQTPCHTWPGSGYKLGMQVRYTNYQFSPAQVSYANSDKADIRQK